MNPLDLLGWLLIGSLPSTLLFALLGIAVYSFANRSGPATGALSALFNLVSLSVLPILVLLPLPKWWTVQWAAPHSAQVRKEAMSWEKDAPVALDDRMSTQSEFAGFAKEKRTGAPLSELLLVEPVQREEHSDQVADSWTFGWISRAQTIGGLLVVGWCLALSRTVLCLRAVQQLRAECREISEPRAVELSQSLAKQFGFFAPVRLYVSKGIVSAATIGWLRPIVLLPLNWESWSSEELRVVLAHEIAHMARRDYLAWVLAQFSLSLHFYHPLVYWLVSRLRRDQELAADLLGSELCGGREQYLVILSHLILRQTSRPAPLLSRPMFSARGTFLWRMRMLHAKKFSGSPRLKSLSISLLALLATVIALTSAGVGVSFGETAPQEPSNAPTKPAGVAGEGGAIKGRIIAADSGKPVEGAKVRVHVRGAPGFPLWLELLSDKDGNYSHNLPLGHSCFFGVIAPPGYYAQDRKAYDDIVITKKGELIVRDFSLQSGSPWKIELAGYTRPQGKPPVISASFESKTILGRQPGPMLFVYANAQGDATLTLPQSGGDCTLHCNELEPSHRFEIPTIDLKIEKGFDPTKLQGEPVTIAKDRSLRLKDSAGKIATVTGAEVINRDGQAVVRFPCKPIPKSAAFKICGMVQTEEGDPISGAKVTAAFMSNTMGSMTELVAYSGEKGEFVIPEVFLKSNLFKEDQRIELVVIKSGFDGVESKQLNLLDIQKSGMADFGTIQLKPGKTLKGKIVDEKGIPVQGAVVSCSDGYFVRGHLACRSGADGRFQIPDLSYGKMKLHVIYGDLAGNEECDFDEKTGEWTIAIRPYKVATTPSPLLPRPWEWAVIFSLFPIFPFR